MSGILESSQDSKRFRITSTKIHSVGPLGANGYTAKHNLFLIEIFRGSTSTGDYNNHRGSYSVGVDNTNGDLPNYTTLLYSN